MAPNELHSSQFHFTQISPKFGMIVGLNIQIQYEVILTATLCRLTAELVKSRWERSKSTGDDDDDMSETSHVDSDTGQKSKIIRAYPSLV